MEGKEKRDGGGGRKKRRKRLNNRCYANKGLGRDVKRIERQTEKRKTRK